MKNRLIELERFVASCLVLLYHMGISKGSWIFVEFFFMLTGYFTMAHIEKKKDLFVENATWYPIQYTLKKYVKIFPYTAISILLMWLIRVIQSDLSLKDLFKWVLCLPAEILLLGGSGMVPNGMQIADGLVTSRLLNAHLWYICSMLFVMPIIVCLLIYIKKYKSIILTIVPLFLYGFLIMKDGTVDGWHDAAFGFIFCNMRAMAGLLLGACAYYLSQWWRARKYTTLGSGVLTFIEIVSFLSVTAISYVTTLRYDALLIGLLFISISLTNSGVTYTKDINGEILDFFGSVSLPIYCLHMPIIYICSSFEKTDNPVFIFGITMVISALTLLVFNKISKWYNGHKKEIHNIFVR